MVTTEKCFPSQAEPCSGHSVDKTVRVVPPLHDDDEKLGSCLMYERGRDMQDTVQGDLSWRWVNGERGDAGDSCVLKLSLHR